MSEQWLSINEYSRVFSISDMTVRRRIRTGRLNAVLRDGKYYIHVLNDHDPFGNNCGSDVPSVVANRTPKVESRAEPRNEPMRNDAAKPRSNGASGLESTISEFKHVPARIAAQISNKSEVSVCGNDLLAFCEESLKKFADFERRIVAENHSKIRALQQEINSKNLEIKQLKQQVEDLQVLVSLMESRR